MAPKRHPNSAKILQITPWAAHVQVPSARSQNDAILAANGGHMGPNWGFPSTCVLYQVMSIPEYFLHSILNVIYESLFGN